MRGRLTAETADWTPVALYASGMQWRNVWEKMGITESTLRGRLEALHRIAGTQNAKEIAAWWRAHSRHD